MVKRKRRKFVRKKTIDERIKTADFKTPEEIKDMWETYFLISFVSDEQREKALPELRDILVKKFNFTKSQAVAFIY